jgi:O-antigen/teichoic acid export membrane protein
VILARLLSPDDYGLAAMVLVFSSLVLIFTDLALGAALIQRRQLTDRDRSTIFWTSAAAGVVFTLIGIALSWPLASFYGEPEVQPLFAALSLSFLVTAIGTTQIALLTREMDFKSLELRQMAGTVVGAVVGITIAVLGYGAWAIIGQQLAVAFVSTVLLWTFSPWRPSLTFSAASLRSLGGFSANVFGTRVLFYLNRNADNLLIGKFLGPAALGLYALAYNVMLAPMSRFAAPIVEVLFPAFSRMQDDRRRLGVVWLRVTRLVGAVTIPAMLGIIAVAPEFVSVLFGSRWETAVPVIQTLAWVGLLQSLQSQNSAILQACDRTRVLLWYSFVALTASLVAFVGGISWGIEGVAVAYAISSTLVEPYYTWLTARVLGLSPLDAFRNLIGVFQAGVLMFGAVLATRAVLPDGMADGARLAILVGIGLLAYLLLFAWREPALQREVLQGLRRRRGVPAPASRGAV